MQFAKIQLSDKRKSLHKIIEQLEKQIKRIETEIAKLIKSDKQWAEKANILESMPGIGGVTAAALLAELPELGELNRQKIAALVSDPLPFGATWQMVFMNFTVSGVGIFMAVRLDEIFRVWPASEERIALTGQPELTACGGKLELTAQPLAARKHRFRATAGCAFSRSAGV